MFSILRIIIGFGIFLEPSPRDHCGLHVRKDTKKCRKNINYFLLFSWQEVILLYNSADSHPDSGQTEVLLSLTSLPANTGKASMQWSLSYSGHSHQRPPSLFWPKSITIKIHLGLPLTKGHLSNVATIARRIGWPYWRGTIAQFNVIIQPAQE